MSIFLAEDINWKSKFEKIASNPEIIVETFLQNVELFVIFEEIFFDTDDPKLISALHIILLVITNHNKNYFAQIDKFNDNSIPKHILSHFIKTLMFGDPTCKDAKISSLLDQINIQSYNVKEYFFHIVSDQIRFREITFLSNLSSANIIKIFELLDNIFLVGALGTIKAIKNYIVSRNIEYDFSHCNLFISDQSS